jgi:predicted ATP-grasp superfamily ATP-dependent carboligase
VAQNHAALSQAFRLITPPWDVTRVAADKHAMYQRAAELGIAYPRSYAPRTRLQVEQLDCTYPLILKPAEKRGFNALTRAKAWRIDGPGELLTKYDEAVAQTGAENIVLQEMIPGGGATQFSYTGVWHGGQPVGEMIARRTRQYPVEFGTGTFVEAVEQEEVAQAARKFLASIGYGGLVEIEFKHDARDGSYKILDVNPRVWTWNALGERAGVDFGDIQWRLAMGEPVARQQARPGAAWMYLSKDIAAAVHEMAAGTLTPGEYFRAFRRPLEFAAFAPDDPLPALIDFPLALWRYVRQRLSGR